KFIPRYNSPYHIISAHPNILTYMLDVPNDLHIHPTFHVSQLKMYIPNNNALFLSHIWIKPTLVINASSKQDWFIDCIIE
ncbi:hypothetical protein CONPUDRAFT_34086, partial [Coniophora puteana RWD-64-598 SS2]